jgi:hypothetical protein
VLTTAALFWNEFRAGQVTQLLREVRQVVDQGDGPETILSAAVFPEAAAAYLENGQEWQAWAKEGLVDRLYPMAYFGDTDRVGNQLREITANTPRNPKVALWAGLGALDKGPEQLGKEARLAGEYGYEGVALFSLGHLRKKTPAPAWAEAVRTPRLSLAPKAETEPLTTANPVLLPPDLQTLKAIVAKALGGAPLKNELEARLARRLQEYSEAFAQAIPRTLNQLASAPLTLPESLELGGIFRYANPMDSPARRLEQERLLAGEELATVAKEMSQDGTKTLGGLLAPRFLDPLNPQDQELARMAPQGISRVMRVANGFWCYRLEGRSIGRKSTFAEAPWEAKRILFRRALGEMMAAGRENGL